MRLSVIIAATRRFVKVFLSAPKRRQAKAGPGTPLAGAHLAPPAALALRRLTRGRGKPLPYIVTAALSPNPQGRNTPPAGELPLKELYEEAEEMGYSKRSMERVMNELSFEQRVARYQDGYRSNKRWYAKQLSGGDRDLAREAGNR